MENRNRQVVYKSTGNLAGLIFVIFLVLKILGDNGTITPVPWLSWFWVFFPLWIGAAIVIGLILVFLLISIVCGIISELIS